MTYKLKFAVGLTACLLSACAIDPKLGPDGGVEHSYQLSPTLPNAVAVGESMLQRYQQVVTDQILGDRQSALGLIGLGMGGGDLAARGIARSSVLGMGLAGVGLYTGSSYINGKPLPAIYAAGVNAVQCALDQTQPRRLAYVGLSDLNADITQLDGMVANLDLALAPYDADPSLNARSLTRTKAARDRAKALLSNARATRRMLAMSGADLHATLAAIQKDVTTAVVNNMDLAAVSANLDKLLSAATTKASPPAPAIPIGSAQPSSESALQVTNEQIRLMNEVEDFVTLASASPDGTSPKSCRVDPAAAGIGISVSPSSGVTLIAGQATTFAITGGKLPYQVATWSGAHPTDDKVTITTETGQGVVTLKATSDVMLGSYLVLVRDSAQASQFVTVTIQAPAAAPVTVNKPTDSSTITTSECVVKNDQVAAVQKGLNNSGITAVSVDGKAPAQPVTVDRCLGKITIAAMKALALKQQPDLKPDQIPSDPLALLAQTVQTLDQIEKVKAKAALAQAPAPAASAAAPAVSKK